MRLGMTQGMAASKAAAQPCGVFDAAALEPAAIAGVPGTLLHNGAQ